MKDIPALTGIRFFAAFAIVLTHLAPVTFRVNGQPLWEDFFKPLPYFAMSLFFVLSGFIIHYNYQSKVSSPAGIYNFFVARFARLYPLFFAVLVYDFFSRGVTWPRVEVLPYYLTMTQSWFYGFIGNKPIVFAYSATHIAWSISTEFFFYLCYPVVCYILLRAPSPRKSLLIAVSFFVPASILMAWAYEHIDLLNWLGVNRIGIVENPSAHPKTVFGEWLVYMSPYARILEFITGCTIASLYMALREHAARKAEQRLMSVATLLALMWIILLFCDHRLLFVGFGPAIALLIFHCARHENALLPRLMSTRPLVELGLASYSLYLLHWIVIRAGEKLVPLSGHTSLLPLIVRAVVLLLVIGVVSLAVYRFYEVPARRWVKKTLSIRDKRARLTAAAIRVSANEQR